jgi:hypothetical protein
MPTATGLRRGLLFGVALLASSCGGDSVKTFTDAYRRAETVVIYEGLPRGSDASNLPDDKRGKRSVREFHGYSFYEPPLWVEGFGNGRLTASLGDPAKYRPFSGEKKCGGFHPDYAVELRLGSSTYRALICFGCSEVKLFGPGLESRHDFSSPELFPNLLHLSIDRALH